jgi:hypothetical protein
MFRFGFVDVFMAYETRGSAFDFYVSNIFFIFVFILTFFLIYVAVSRADFLLLYALSPGQ